MIKLLIFDLDGTLADTLTTVQAAINMTAEKHGMRRFSYEDVKGMIGTGAKNFVRMAMEGLDESLYDEIYATYSEEYARTHLDVDVPYEGIYEMLLRLRKSGYILAVLSNKPHAFTKGVVEKLFGSELFSFVSGQTATAPLKPDPTVPLALAEQFGCSAEEAVFVGDSEVDIKTAKNAGMLSAVFDWGYGNIERMTELCPDAIVGSAKELEAFLASRSIDTEA